MAEEAPTGGERTEDPSAKRREDFRQKGQVAQSKEVQTAALFSLALLFWLLYMPHFWNGLTTLVGSIWRSAEQFQGTPSATAGLSFHILKEVGLLLAPFFVLVLIIGFFSSFFQFGWLLTAKPFMPDFSKLDPIAGMGRLFSKRSLVESIKSIAKITLIGWIAFSTVLAKFNEALILVDTSTSATMIFLAKTAGLILSKVCGLLILLAFIDFLYVRWEMEEKLKMTKQEQKEEFKESEGDPHIKAQIRALQQQMAKKRMMAEVPKADAVITNPTHLAVAIKYDPAAMVAPIVVAKGADFIAMRIREIARENNIPLVENPPVARLLHKLDLGAAIPEEMFKAVAEILAHIYSLKGKSPK
ncbi:MAG: flagellar biosynthesis protein FlhB [Proteobacteria bacterium]|nr:flagellar biosynthesis protein FlhB [Pseudomonadota bacterium]MBU1649783.1 flagellar biosynthesis protein FlhB [Pseudomonadota bacterium]